MSAIRSGGVGATQRRRTLACGRSHKPDVWHARSCYTVAALAVAALAVIRPDSLRAACATLADCRTCDVHRHKYVSVENGAAPANAGMPAMRLVASLHHASVILIAPAAKLALAPLPTVDADPKVPQYRMVAPPEVS